LLGIIGLGSVGQAAQSTLNSHFGTVGYDIDGRGDWNNVLQTRCVFVCVSTNAAKNGILDMSNIYSVSEMLSNSDYPGLIIIKSTLQPRTIDRIKQRFPNLRVAYIPEFLREKDAHEWFKNPDRIVYSCDDLDEKELLDYFTWVSESIPRIRMSHLEAEFGKLAHNAYIATKVTFTCEIERICELNSIDANKVMEVVWRDRRVNNPAHLVPYLGGFSGKCVPKDTLALVAEDPDSNSMLHSLFERGEAENVRRRLE
tara:strand:+ start:3273 stop:4040 length:768 start_codon:yes stop_codon:yes gene_type:complete